jgi:predicted nucleic acid-binding protein
VHGVLVDAGALVGLLDEADGRHEASVEAVKDLHDPLATVWPVVTEAMYLLADTPRAGGNLCDMVTDGGVQLIDLNAVDLRRIKELMAKYRDLPMDFADAALVRAAEREGLNRIVTFDHHFHVYRLPRRGRFSVLP